MHFPRRAFLLSCITSLLSVELSPHGVAQCLEWDRSFGLPGLPSGAVIWTMAVFDDGAGPALFAGGWFTSPNPTAFLGRWNGSEWSSVGSGIGGDQSSVSAMTVFDDGSGPALVVGGHFSIAGGRPANDIAKWDGLRWSALGGGLSGPGGWGFDFVDSLAAFDDGTGPKLFVGGSFSTAGGVSALDVARWDGHTWLEAGVLGRVNAFATLDTGSGPKLYVAAMSNLCRWENSQWTQLVSTLAPGGSPHIDALEVFDDGSGPALYFGGHFGIAGGKSARNFGRWDGSSCTAVGEGIGVVNSDVLCLAVYDDGSGPALFASGPFDEAGGVPANHIARWNGSVWSPLAGGVGTDGWEYPISLVVYDGGGGRELVAAGTFGSVDGSRSRAIAAWRGCTGPGTRFCFGDGGTVECPCSNAGAPEHGCANSDSASGGFLVASGATHPDSVVLHSSGEPARALSIFLQSVSAVGPLTFGDGLRCLAGRPLELYVRTASNGAALAPKLGDPSISSRSAALGDPIRPGTERIYQVTYRDSTGGFCPPPRGGGWNLTNAFRIRW